MVYPTHRSCVERQIYPAKVGSRNEHIRVGVYPSVEGIERFGAAPHFTEDTEDVVTQPQIQREIRPPLELILDITEKIRLAQAVDRIVPRDAGLIGFIGRKIGKGVKTDRAIGTAPLVHLRAAELDSGFDYVSSLNPCQIVDFAKCIASAGVGFLAKNGSY